MSHIEADLKRYLVQWFRVLPRVDVMPGLPRTLFWRDSLGVRVPEVSQVFVEQRQEELVIGRVPSASGQIEAADEGDQASQVRIRAWSVGDDALLVVGVRAGGELVLEVVCQLVALLQLLAI